MVACDPAGGCQSSNQLSAIGRAEPYSPGVPSPPACMGPVAERADQRIDERIEHQSDGNDASDRAGGQAHDLIVIKQQEHRKSVVLDAVGDGTNAVVDLCPKWHPGSRAHAATLKLATPAIASSSYFLEARWVAPAMRSTAIICRYGKLEPTNVACRKRQAGIA
jgi:hypothetical protein